MTATKPVLQHWFPRLANCHVPGSASGGGQQAPILAAAEAIVTLLDFSPKQLAQDSTLQQRRSNHK